MGVLIIEEIDMIESLRNKLVLFVKRKFSNINDIENTAEDIVNEAILNCRSAKNYKKENENFGYLSKVCINIAIKNYKLQKQDLENTIEIKEESELVCDSETLDTVINELDKEFIENSLNQLKEVEKKILYLRYYNDYTFGEICSQTNIKLNTVLSHHRRAIEKLRPTFVKYFDYEDPYESEYMQNDSGIGYLGSYKNNRR